MDHPSRGGSFDGGDEDGDDEFFDPDEDDEDLLFDPFGEMAREVERFIDPDDEADDAPLPKPDELLALHGITAELFETLKRWFEVPNAVPLDLAEVDSAVAELGDPQMVAALAMRKLQALHLLATPGVRTATDVVVAIVNDLERAMVQAPNMWLKRRASVTDWDRAFEDMASESVAFAAAPAESDDVDPEVLRFRTLHGLLHDAMFAVIDASEGEIRELE